MALAEVLQRCVSHVGLQKIHLINVLMIVTVISLRLSYYREICMFVASVFLLSDVTHVERNRSE